MRTEDLSQIADHSRIIHVARTSAVMTRAAWRSSLTGRLIGAARTSVMATPALLQLRWGALVIAVAAAGHLILRSMMSITVSPAMPASLVTGIAILAAAVAWQPAAFARAWRSSRVAVRLRAGGPRR